MLPWIRQAARACAANARLLCSSLVLTACGALAPAMAHAQTSSPTTPFEGPIATFQLPPDAANAGVQARQVYVDAAPFTGTPGGEYVVYDLDGALRPVSTSGLKSLPDWAVAVRLVLSEVGADRVLNSRYGLLEAMGVIETVRNRLDPAQYNPAGIAGLAPWPGCKPGSRFADCANPQQYYGLLRDRALSPATSHRSRDQLLRAIDVAVAAWWLLDTHVVHDVTRGATSFVHRCGGSRYGAPQSQCSGSEAVTGPIVFSGPRVWSRSAGRYEMSVTRRIDYRSGGTFVGAGFYASYLWGGADDVAWEDGDFSTDPDELDEIWRTGRAD
jgi:hypothetical protein